MAHKLYPWNKRLHNPTSNGYNGRCSSCRKPAKWTAIFPTGYQKIWAFCDACLLNTLRQGKQPKVID